MIILTMVCNPSAAQTNPLSAAEWLLGKWENQTQRGKMVEEWSKLNDSTFAGRSYVITATDSIALESILLKKERNDLYYIPTVKGQNNDQPVKFKLKSSDTNSLVFENPAHDFPQKISYTLESERSLLAEISGMMNGQQRSRKFPMKKTH
ncbi:MAG: hypothetical protein DI535_14460 [Citrobacter freundii]|nr:MAG: hypothetical protein DI535_14460 [Citrobacter freundii]